MAWKPEVKVQGKWSRNGLAFATEQEAKDSAFDLMMRWTSVEEDRAVEVVGEPATHSYLDHELKALDTAPKTIPNIVADYSMNSDDDDDDHTPLPANLWQPGNSDDPE